MLLTEQQVKNCGAITLIRGRPYTGAALVTPLGAEEVDIVFTYQDRLFINVDKDGNYNNFTLLSYQPSTGIVVEEEESLDFYSKPIIYDDTLYFSGDDSTYNSEELHRYHPSMGFELIQFNSLRDRTLPSNFTIYQGNLYFSIQDDVIQLPDGFQVPGGGLYRYSSITGKMEEVIHNTPYGIGKPRELTILNDTLYYQVDDYVHGEELWRYHPSTGAKMVADIQPGENWNGSNIREVTKYRGALYFEADDGTHGDELWR